MDETGSTARKRLEAQVLTRAQQDPAFRQQLSHDPTGGRIAPAALAETGKPADVSLMAEQMPVTSANAATILAQFGATLDHVVEETLSVLDVDAAFAVVGKVRKEADATARPQGASNLIGVARLAFPEQRSDIVFTAGLSPASTAAAGYPREPRTNMSPKATHDQGDNSHEGNRCDRPGGGNGRDEAGRTARAAGSDKRRYRSDSCVGIRPDRAGVALDLDRSPRP